MDLGHFLATYVIIFREALEACLIIGIIVTILDKLKQNKFIPHVLLSSLFAVGLSVVAGIWLINMTQSMQGQAGKILEGVISVAACFVLTYMIFWMNQQSKRIKSDFEQQIETAMTKEEYFTIISLPFLAVFREGAETVLFISALAGKSNGVSVLAFCAGILTAVIIACLIFIGGKRIKLKPLFKSTSYLLLLIAAGLLAYGIHELQEAQVIPELLYPVWNINHILSDKEGIGYFLKAIFGYNGNPSLIEVSSYVTYIGIVLLLLNVKEKASNQS